MTALAHRDQQQLADLPAKHCGSRHTHDMHVHDRAGVDTLCMGDVAGADADRGQCCADPLCPCADKPGWGPYAAPGLPASMHSAPSYDD